MAVKETGESQELESSVPELDFGKLVAEMQESGSLPSGGDGFDDGFEDDETEAQADPLAGWKYPDVEAAHGFLRGKSFEEVENSIRSTQRSMQEAQTERNRLREKVEALEMVLLRRQAEGAPGQPVQQPVDPKEEILRQFNEKFFDNPVEAMAEYTQFMEKTAEEKALHIAQQIVHQRETQTQVANAERMSINAAATVFSAAGVPEDAKANLFDWGLARLVDPNSPYAQNGGPLNPDNWAHVVSSLGYAFSEQPSQEARPAGQPARARAQEPSVRPVGTSPHAQSVGKVDPLASVPKATLETWKSVAQMSGVSAEDMPEFLREMAEKQKRKR